MKYNKVGNTDIEISEVTIGSWAFGKGGYFDEVTMDKSVKVLNAAIDAGINHIDTAELYGWGDSEKSVGNAVADKRDKVIISSKVWNTHLKYEDTIKACEDSLKRLQTDYLDFLYIHYYVDEYPLEDTMEALLKLQKDGKIRYIGASNFPKEQLERALKIGRIDIYQPCYSLLWRYDDKDIVPYVIDNNISMVAYSPLAQGILTGKYKEDSIFTDGRKNAALFQGEYYKKAIELVENLIPIANANNMTMAQLALKWVSEREGFISSIAGAKTIEQAVQNAKTGEFNLSKDDFDKIDKLSKKYCEGLPNFRLFFSKDIID